MSEIPALIARPFHFLIQEHAKCMVAIKDLQEQVQSLQEFRATATRTLMQIRHQTNSGLQQDGGSCCASPSPPTPVVTRRPPSTTGRVLPTIRDGLVRSPNNASSDSLVELDSSTSTIQGSPKPRRITTVNNNGACRRNSQQSPSSQKFVVVAQGKNWLRIRPYSERGPDSEVDADSDEPNSDSLRSGVGCDSLINRRNNGGNVNGAMSNSTTTGGARSGRQDSGFSTDQHQADRSVGLTFEHNIDSKEDGVETSNDELLGLLEEIESRSAGMKSELDRWRTLSVTQKEEQQQRAHYEDFTNTNTELMSPMSDVGLCQHDLLAELDRLRREKEQLVERLSTAEDKALFAHVRLQQLEDRLRTAATEREQLDSRIHGMHLQFVRNGSTGGKNFSNSSLLFDRFNGDSDSKHDSTSSMTNTSCSAPNSLPEGVLQGRVHVKPNTVRITAVLRETRVLELQRQLLTAIMENEVLKTQLEQVTKDWSTRSKEYQRETEGLQTEIRQRQTSLDKSRLELQTERARLRMLQRALHVAEKEAPLMTSHAAQSLRTLSKSLADSFKDQRTNTEQATTTEGSNNSKNDDDDDDDKSPLRVTGFTDLMTTTTGEPTTKSTKSTITTIERDDVTSSSNSNNRFRSSQGDDDNPTTTRLRSTDDDVIVNGGGNNGGGFVNGEATFDGSHRQLLQQRLKMAVAAAGDKCDVPFSWGPPAPLPVGGACVVVVDNGVAPMYSSLGGKPRCNEVLSGANSSTSVVQHDVHQRIQNFLQRFSERIAPLETMPDDKDYLETGL